MTDTASIGIKVETSDVERGIKTLAQLAQQGKTTETAISGLESAAKKAGSGMQSISAGAGKTADGVRKTGEAAKNAAEEVSDLSSSFNVLKTVFAATVANQFVGQLASMADAATNVNSRLSLVTDSAAQLSSVQRELFSTAQDSRVGFLGLVDTYAQVARSTKEVGISHKSLLDITKTISQAITISGGSAASSQAALVQLSQGFAAGALRGEELNSVMEQTPRLAQAIAQGLGVSIGQLRAMGQEGELTSEKVLGALQKAASQVDAEFQKMAQTIEQSVTQAENSFQRLVGVVDKITGASASAASGIGSFSKNLDSLATDIERLSANSGNVSDFFFLFMNNEKALNAELAISQAELDRLQERLAKAPDNIYAKSATNDMQRYVDKIKEAIARLNELSGGGSGSKAPGGIDPGNFPSRGSQAGYLRERDNAQKKLLEISARESGISKQFTDDLNAYSEGLRTGAITAEEYAAAVNKLNTERAKSLEKKNGGGGSRESGRIDSAQTKSAVSEIQSSLRDLTSSYSVAESIMEARRSAGLLDEKEYYDAKKSFIELNKQAQVSALKEEAAALQSQQLKGAEAIARDQKVAELKAKVAQLSIDAAGKLEVLEIQQAAAANQHASALLAAKQAADEYILSIQRASAVEVLGIGRGDRWRQDETGRLGVQDKFADQRRTLANQRAQQEMAGPLSPEAVSRYEQSLAQINAAEREALAVYQDGVAQRVAAESDWSNGAIRAMENYRDTSANVAAQTANAFSSAFQGMEDALVSFAMTGKADFKSLANSIIADLLRVQARAAISGIFSNILGSVAGSIGGGSTAGGGNAAQGLKLNALGGVYESPSLSAYSNQVHSTPKLFAFAKGAGVFGEAGPEAIMPLTRAPDGNLGVRAMGGGGAINLTLSPVITIDSRSDRADVEAQIASGMKIAADYAQQQLLYKMNRGMV